MGRPICTKLAFHEGPHGYESLNKEELADLGIDFCLKPMPKNRGKACPFCHRPIDA